jgi:hypothetical protein
MPKSTRSKVATAWAVVAQDVAGASASMDNLTRCLALPKAIFPHVPASTSRGGLSAPAIIRERLRRWTAGDLFALFEEAVCRATQRVPNGTSFSADTTRIRRTRGLARQGAFRKAAQALSSAPQAPSAPATVAGLLELHPPAVSGPVLDRSVLPPPTLISASEVEVESALSGFLRGSAPGASGLRHSHLADMLHAPSPQAAALASDAVTNLVNRLASGRAPTSFAPWLCGAPLTALAKPNGGVRPISVGEVMHRLVAKCLMARVRQPA